MTESTPKQPVVCPKGRGVEHVLGLCDPTDRADAVEIARPARVGLLTAQAVGSGAPWRVGVATVNQAVPLVGRRHSNEIGAVGREGSHVALA